MTPSLINLAYLAASVLFILGLKGLAHPRTAVRANLTGATGMLLAIVATLLDRNILGSGAQAFTLIFAAILVGSIAGAVLALRLFIPDKAIGIFAIPMIAIVLFHLGLVVYLYIFADTPVTAYLAGDLVFLLVMAGVSSALLGENAFRSVMERFIERVG